MIYLGRCSDFVQEALQALVTEHDRVVGLAGEASWSTDHVLYTNLFARDTPPRLVAKHAALLGKAMDELVQQAYGTTPVWVLTAGYIESPVGCRPQYWHYDYGAKTENIFIPLTPLTERNGMEYVEWLSAEAGPAQVSRYGGRLSELLPLDLAALGIAEPYRIRRAAAAPYDVLRMPWHLLHHGISNQEPWVRRVFFMCMTLHPHFDLAPHDKQPVVSWA
jgi:hypothetical protein